MSENDDEEDDTNDWFPNIKKQARDYEWFPNVDTFKALRSTRVIYVVSKLIIGIAVILVLYLLNNYFEIIPL